jgi:chromosomal replication initiation ATPase DnaA
LDLGFLRGLTRRRDASRARAIVGYLAKVYGRISYATTARFFNRDASTLAKDVRSFEDVLRISPQEREHMKRLAAKLLRTSDTPCFHA